MYNLTIPQQNIWNLQKYYENTSISNICGAIFFEDEMDTQKLKNAINQLIEHQSGLRLHFSEVGGDAIQRVSAYRYEDIPVKQFSSKELFEQYATNSALKSFGMIESSLYRFTIFQIGTQTGVLAVLSHLISDAWTFSLMARQLYMVYQNLSAGIGNCLEDWDYVEQIKSEAEYLASKRYDKDDIYWKEKYAEKPEPSTLKLSPTPVTSIAAKRFVKVMAPQLAKSIERYCAEMSITPAVLFETAVIVYLAKVNPENKTITIGSPILNRKDSREKNTVGMFISTMPLTIAVSEEDTLETIFEKLTTGHRELFRHHRYPYSYILKKLREEQNFSGNLYDVMVSYQNARTDMQVKTEWFSNGYSEVPFVLHIDNRDSGDSYTWTIDYQTEVFHQTEILLIIDRLDHIISQMLCKSTVPLSEISIIPDSEYQKVIHDFNDTAVEYPKDKCVHQLFEEQAAKTPDKVALVFEDRQFTYRQLDKMSNSVAHFLRAKGIGRNDIVPIIAKRSWHVIVAMLGILKAGGAYMPIDPTYPKDRIEYMINAAKCDVALTFGYMETLSVETISLDDFDLKSNATPVENITNPEDLCYLIFTSGSTGNPKGVSICHQNVLNYCDNNNNNNVCHAIIEANYHSIVSVTNIVFDIFVTESLLPLLNGITIYFANDEQVFSQNLLSDLICTKAIDVIQTTPTKMRSYIMDKQNVAYLKRLKAIVLGGEALPADLYEELLTYTNAHIFNIYGPAETTVWSTNKKMESADIIAVDYSGNSFVHQIFEVQAKYMPDKTALIACDRTLTYRELNEEANHIAHSLIEMGIGVGDIVAFALPRRSYLISVIFGILKTGAAYMPIDLNYPKDRIEYMLQDSQSRFFITEKNILNLLKNNYAYNPAITVNENDSFCALHTSGSTGTPKISLLKHGGIRNWLFANRYLWDEVDVAVSATIATFDAFILDKHHHPLPIGVAGELCISGDGVGKGYLNRPELTAEKFIPNPFLPGKTMYCTGDLARWRTDGEIEYLGRMDTQVKIRGLRIELGEIESVMSSFDGIGLAAVTDKRDETGRQYLVGYYTAEGSIDEKALRQHLSSKLPKYMVPNYFAHLNKMPMTPSGKTDHKNLPSPEFATQERKYVTPQTQTEKKISAIWEELLKITQASRTDDFFELGGDSLMAIALLSKLQNVFDVSISIKDILEFPVLEQFAAIIDQAQSHHAKIAATGAQQYALLPQQLAIYAVCSKDPQTLAYNMPAYLKWNKSIDKERLKVYLCQLFELHPELKTSIHSEGGVVYATFDKDSEIIFEEYAEQDLQKFVRPFDLSKAPLVRIGFTETAMLFDIHHIIADGESINVILHDLAMLYNGSAPQKADFLYSDYAAYFHAADFAAHETYFKNMLKCDFEPLALPEKKHMGDTEGASCFYQIDKDTFEKGRKFARENKLTDTMVFLGAFGILLSRYTARTDILSSVVLTNRVHKETQNITGMFVNTLPIMLPVVGTTADYWTYIHNLVLDLYQYQEVPLFEITKAVGMGSTNVVNTSFVYQASGAKQLALGGTKLMPAWIDTHTAKFDLTFELTPDDTGCGVRIEYDCGKYEKSLIDRLFEGYLRIIEQLEKENIADISVLSETEYKKVVFDFNDTFVDYHRDECVYELFERQVKHTPDKTALIFANKCYTYRQLDELSNGLTISMRNLGIRQGDMVAVLLNRDEKVILAQLAVLKIGAVFIPIDNRYPKERIEYILAESGAKVIIKNASTDLTLAQAKNIEDMDMSPAKLIDHPQINSGDTCYVIFTSGSTGKPKGCTLTNRGLVNFCRNNNILDTCNKLDRQVCISVNTISFDYFIAESLLPLTNGYTIVLASEEESVDRDRFINLAVSTHANIIQTTPTRFKLYFDEKRDLSFMRQFDVIVTSGEALPLELLNTFHRNSNARIFNPLGPSECSVWVAGGELHLGHQEAVADDITIGKPIANTQIYILDQDHNPLPIGVVGELCVSGDGVGNGYLNRPKLTAEKFIPNPFLPGKAMYCTGDLARWRTNGEIEYLGRMDTQHKIRGLRIELGEIESVMSGFAGIGLTAVTDKRDETGRQYLVGYYTTDSSIDEKALRQYLSSKLPKYMVPNYLVHLEKMPTTPSGKMDRKNLPTPEFSAMPLEQTHIPPRNEKEQTLCRIIGGLLGYTRIGIEDDFFELGGDSLKAIEFVTKAHGAGIYIALQNVFDYPTVKSLCDYLQDKPRSTVPYEVDRLASYESILQKNTWDPEFIPQHRKLGTIFLTGGTGFLGAHILDALMKRGADKIYCLVRASSERLVQRLHYYFGDQYVDELGKTIIPVIGDLETDGIGDNLPEHVDYVIHAAASVKHYGSWSYFKRANVDGTMRIVTYAKKISARFIHISTISVSGNDMADQFDVYVSEEEKHFYESSLYIGQPLDNVYVRSKFEAEMVVLDAVQKGLKANIIRVGNLTNRKSDLKFQPNYTENAFLKRVKAVLELGCIPDYLMSMYAEFSPVDSTADAVAAIAAHMNDQYTVFHVNSNQNLYFDRMLEYLEQSGYRMEIMSGDQFAKRIRATIDSRQAYIFEALSNDLSQDDKLQYDSNIRIENTFTIQYLKSIGFEWPEIDYAYVEHYLRYFTQLGYFGGPYHEEK